MDVSDGFLMEHSTKLMRVGLLVTFHKIKAQVNQNYLYFGLNF